MLCLPVIINYHFRYDRVTKLPEILAYFSELHVFDSVVAVPSGVIYGPRFLRIVFKTRCIR